MKKLFLLLSTVFMLTSYLEAQTLSGKWRGYWGGELGMLTFDKSGYATLTIGKQKFGGKKIKIEDQEVSMIYELNESSNPKTLDLILVEYKSREEITRMSGIYKEVNPNTIVLNIAVNGGLRPTEFDDNSPDQVVLNRIK